MIMCENQQPTLQNKTSIAVEIKAFRMPPFRKCISSLTEKWTRLHPQTLAINRAKSDMRSWERNFGANLTQSWNWNRDPKVINWELTFQMRRSMRPFIGRVLECYRAAKSPTTKAKMEKLIQVLSLLSAKIFCRFHRCLRCFRVSGVSRGSSAALFIASKSFTSCLTSQITSAAWGQLRWPSLCSRQSHCSCRANCQLCFVLTGFGLV